MRKAVILAGGTGTRLSPMTKIINKHLLPVGRYPMIYWSLFKLQEACVKDILIITSRDHLDSFQQLLGDGKEFGVRLSYAVQEEASGIAAALSIAKTFVQNEKFLVILGDNLFDDKLTPFIEEFKQQEDGAYILLKKVQNPKRYGIACIDDKTNKVYELLEKPNIKGPAYCVTGIYMYDPTVFSFIEQVSPSARGELEITDVNLIYVKRQAMAFNFLKDWWIDAGTPESLFEANYHYFTREKAAGGYDD
ncbi:sugar phosphate nucleotidyltransferase [Alkalihalobacterium bogoriense]|uniref:sugar phosphate nucleotidyltransferase n=1 Tax=Alkalihalobacterium bogoriense TaxID=246272 RepID=UPI0006848CA9|nr:sugar phosphate nucleotidyltransferase [Alkalihalobacterium bogoriense]